MSVTTASSKSFPWLLAAQTQVVFTDNATKLALIGLLQFPGIVAGDHGTLLVSLMAGLLVLPFILFAPLSGWIADRFPKRSVLHLLLIVQVLLLAGIAFSLRAENLPGAIVGFGLLALQSCLFSPAKQGILKELVGEERLGVAVGWMGMFGIAAILTGSLGGAWLFDHFTAANGGNPWRGAWFAALPLGLGAVAALLAFQPVARTRSVSREPFRIPLLWQHFNHVGRLWTKRPLRLAALGNAYFHGLGGIVYLSLIELGRTLHGGGTGSVTEAGILFAVLGAGVAAGSLAAAAVSRKRIELGLIPVGSLAMLSSLLAIGLSDPASLFFRIAIGGLGLSSGWFIVPINAFLQSRAPNEERGRILAANNLLANLAGIGAVALHYVLSRKFGLSVDQQFLLLALPAAAVTLYLFYLLPDSLVAWIVRIIVRIFYRARARHLENLPPAGALLACNHVSYLDAVVIQSVLHRRVRFMGFSGLKHNRWIRIAFRWFRVIPVDAEAPREGIREAVTALRAGEIVCIFPEGRITRTGSLQTIKNGFSLIARRGNVPIVPAHLDGLWGSFFSFFGGRFFRKAPRFPAPPVSLTIGRPLDAAQTDPAKLQQALLDLAHGAFKRRPDLRGSLAARPSVS